MEKELEDFLTKIKPPIVVTLAFWVIHCLKVALNGDWSRFGIFPQELDGLRGIFLAPLLHADWGHLAANSAPFLLTGILMMVFFPSIALRAFVMMWFFTGLAVWSFGRPVYHIGASGVVYAMVSFLFWSGVLRRSPRSIFLALTILSLYSGMFAGILPDQPNVSWESHLLGALVGIAVAYYFKEDLEEDEVQKSKWEHIPMENRPFLFARDTFQYTKAQRQAMEEERLRLEHEERLRQFYLEQQQQQNLWNSNHTGGL